MHKDTFDLKPQQQQTHTQPFSLLTCVVLTADTGVASLPAGAHPSVQAGVGVAQVDLRLAVIAREAHRAAAAQARDRVDGPEQDGGRGDERGRAVKAQHRDALHVVLAGLAQTHVVVEREDLERRGEERGREAVIVEAAVSTCTW